jgi:hypothetical protein
MLVYQRVMFLGFTNGKHSEFWLMKQQFGGLNLHVYVRLVKPAILWGLF